MVNTPSLVVEKTDNSLYTNGINITSTYFDFIFTFSLNKMHHEENKVSQKELVNIYMSPQHAKSLLIILQDQIEKHEKQFGVLDVPLSNIINIEGK